VTSRTSEPGAPFVLGHRPTLDGIRGVAVLSVLLYHARQLPFEGGFLGVNLFFVLSGFLITALLYEEWSKRGAISLKAFYVRRALRLIPALLLFMGVTVAASGFLEDARSFAQARTTALLTLGYVVNWFVTPEGPGHYALGHAWSLAIEEQFYLAWPILLSCMLVRNWSRRSVAATLLLLIAASALVRAYYWSVDLIPTRAYYYTWSRLDGILMGALAALILSWRGRATVAPARIALLNLGGVLGGAFYLGTLWTVTAADPFLYYGGMFAQNAGLALLLASLAVSPWRATERLFSAAPLVWAGKVSYGAYLWHLPVYWMARRLGWNELSAHWVVTIPVTFLLAAASFYLLERPLISRFKPRWVRV
jgi:peptidoglycan/LPS O-acetylase OafA/YrhL